MSASRNTAKDFAREADVQEPSMEEILASIKQIIADDEAGSSDGLSERERYTHPTDHSNANYVHPDAEAPDQPIAAPRPKQSSLEQRLEEYRHRDRKRMERLAGQSGLGPSTLNPDPPEFPRMPVDNRAQQVSAPVQVAREPAPVQRAATEYVAKELDVTAVVEKLARDAFARHEPEIESRLLEAMAPVVRKWLGDNLPALVERLVRQEIEQVSRQSQE